MRLVLIVLVTLIAIGDAVADTSRMDKVAHIVGAVRFRDQIVVFKQEMTRNSIEALSEKSGRELDQNVKDIIEEEIRSAADEIIDDYIAEVIDAHLELYTDAEIDALYQFYQTREGISIGSKQPALQPKIFRIDARYLELLSERALPRIAERLEQAGID